MSVFVIPGGPLDTNHMCVAAPYEQLNVCKELESEGLPPDAQEFCKNSEELSPTEFPVDTLNTASGHEPGFPIREQSPDAESHFFGPSCRLASTTCLGGMLCGAR